MSFHLISIVSAAVSAVFLFMSSGNVFADDLHEHSSSMQQRSSEMHVMHDTHMSGQPAGVMGAHTHHHEKAWMLTYRYM